MKKLSVAIIGCGNIFPMHAEPISNIEGINLVAVCDNKEERAKLASEKYNCKYYIDYVEMLDSEELDVVHICTPHYLHPIMEKEIVNRNIHVMTEKPMSINYNDAVMMIDEAKKNDVTLGVIFQNRYNPGSVLIKEALDQGKLGRVLSARLYLAWSRSDEYYSKSDWKGTWDKEGGGVLIDQAIHTIDLANWLINKDIDYIDANISNRAHEIIEVEDAAEGVVRYKDGTTLAFHTINYHAYDAPVEIELFCEHGVAHMIASTATIKYNSGREEAVDPKKSEKQRIGKSYWGVSHIIQIEQFYKALMCGKKPEITGEEALITQRIICGMYESGKEHKKVKF
ncbi:Gfo/Idh/MocA family protein [Vallitalea okinawensis]|uniref:Gfo/Idh/MocA family protein n=1 Tax=Vallitalea okinawensis TaxID=2078660 RepID=UPI000CFCD07C|nr:Gfo/Idh/MocA family oxidoreductase [Vallitalea okinawensis]